MKGTLGAEEGDNGWPNWRIESAAVCFKRKGRVCVLVSACDTSRVTSRCATQTFLYNNIIISTNAGVACWSRWYFHRRSSRELRECATIENQFPCARRVFNRISRQFRVALMYARISMWISDKRRTDAHRFLW